jgi:hypothetical protein
MADYAPLIRPTLATHPTGCGASYDRNSTGMVVTALHFSGCKPSSTAASRAAGDRGRSRPAFSAHYLRMYRA